MVLMRFFVIACMGLLASVGWAELEPLNLNETPTVAAARLVSGPVQAKDWQVLSKADVKAYEALLKKARAGQPPSSQALAALQDDLLVGHVRGEYLLGKHPTTFAEAGKFLQQHRDLPQATAVYRLAEAKRPGPKQVCKNVKKTSKVAIRNKEGQKTGKTRNVTRNVKQCSTVGSYAPMPPLPLVTELRQARREAVAAANDRDLAALGPDGRKLSGQVWRLRSQGKLKDVLALLLESGSRSDLGSARWQGELVRLADAFHGKQDWRNVARAAGAAAEVSGPNRDEALWLAGLAAYQEGAFRPALRYWQMLAEEEPQGGAKGGGVFGKHFARGAWWAARVAEREGDEGLAKQLLALGARDRLSFYGQLSAAKLGVRQDWDWAAPTMNAEALASLKAVPGVRRGLALAQLGELELAQQELKLADADIPYQAANTLAALAMQLKLPATALGVGKQLRERGEVLPAALYPVPAHWQPTEGWATERALVYGIMRQESAFFPSIGSRVGAQGLMQIMPATGQYIARLTGRSYGGKADLHNPAVNLGMAQDYLNYLNGKLDGNVLFVVAAYNGGIGNVQRWLARGVTPDDDPVRWLEAIPFDETRDYVEKVLANYWIYQQRLGETPWSLQALADGKWPKRWMAAAPQGPAS
jgi:soluble lytic murein transglycosylase